MGGPTKTTKTRRGNLIIAIAIYPVIGAIISLLMYVLSSNAKVSEIGRILFMTAMLVVWMVVSGKVVKL